MSTPDEVLEKTRAIILERGQHHGQWRSNMDNIADLWSSFLGRRVSGAQVAVMLGLVKVSRITSAAPGAAALLRGVPQGKELQRGE